MISPSEAREMERERHARSDGDREESVDMKIKRVESMLETVNAILSAIHKMDGYEYLLLCEAYESEEGAGQFGLVKYKRMD